MQAMAPPERSRIRSVAEPGRVKGPVERLLPLAGDIRAWKAGEVLQREGARPQHLWVVLSGWLARTRSLRDGRRQIVRLVLPGDVGPAPRLSSPSCAIVAITAARTASLAPLETVLGSDEAPWPQARELLHELAQAEEAELLDHVVRLGRMSAYERTGHMLLELYERLVRAGLAAGDTMPLPLTQEALADLLGMSIVHMNRTLQQLRSRGLIVDRGSKVMMPDLRALASECGYDLGPAAEPSEQRSFAPA